MRIIRFYLLLSFLPVMMMAEENLDGFKLVDHICAKADGFEPILLDDIRSKAKQESSNLASAFDKLLKQKALFLYAQKQLKIDTKEIDKLADKHIEDILSKNKLTLNDLKASLADKPYFSTIRQLKNQIAYSMLEGQIRSQLKNQIKISESQVKAQLIKENREKYQLVFIEFSKSDKLENEQTALANKIREDIINNISLEELKALYRKSEGIEISEPRYFKKGQLLDVYEKMIEKTNTVSELFMANGKPTIIWKTKKTFLNEDLNKNDLEELEKHLYEQEIEKKLMEIKNISVKEKEIMVNSCELSL